MKTTVQSIQPDKWKTNASASQKIERSNEWKIVKSMNKLMKNIEIFLSVNFQDQSELVGTCFNRTAGHIVSINTGFINVVESDSVSRAYR